MTNCGTSQWTAPEVLRGEKYGVKADIYSFAILMWEVFSQKIPYTELKLNQTQIAIQVVNRKIRPNLNLLLKDTPEEFKQLITNCWDEEPNLRPDAEKICKEIKSYINNLG